MDNFIENSLDYLFYSGGFDLITNGQRFEFRIRPNGDIEVTEITNHIKKVYTNEPDIYYYFAYLIFCDMYSSHQKSRIMICKDKKVSHNNLKALNRVYVIYHAMLSLNGEKLAASLSDENPSALDIAFIDEAFENAQGVSSNLKYNLLKARIETLAYDFSRRYEYFDNVYNTLITSKEYEPIYNYALYKWEKLEGKEPSRYVLTKEDMINSLFSLVNTLEKDMQITIEGGELSKRYIINTLLTLTDREVDIIDVIYFIKCTFYLACDDEKEYVQTKDFTEAIEVSYLDDDIKLDVINRLKKNSYKKSNNKILQLNDFKR